MLKLGLEDGRKGEVCGDVRFESGGGRDGCGTTGNSRCTYADSRVVPARACEGNTLGHR